jgi:hypothetical protein
MRIDIHTHVFPEEIVQDRSRFFEGEPSFKTMYESPRAKLTTVQALLQAMDEDGVDRAVIFGFPWEDSEQSVRHNDYVLESAAKHASRLIAFGCMNPLNDRSLSEAERCLQSGAKGLGELALYGNHDSKEALRRYKDIIECCKAHGDAILLVHANEPVGHLYPGKAPLGLDFYYDLARLAAGLPLILAHWGGGLCFYELLKRDAAQVLEKVYYDTAASPFLYQPDIYSMMARSLGKGKILFGSDYPLLPPSRYFKEMEGSRLTKEEEEAILGGNAARLLGIEIEKP